MVAPARSDPQLRKSNRSVLTQPSCSDPELFFVRIPNRTNRLVFTAGELHDVPYVIPPDVRVVAPSVDAEDHVTPSSLVWKPGRVSAAPVLASISQESRATSTRVAGISSIGVNNQVVVVPELGVTIGPAIFVPATFGRTSTVSFTVPARAAVPVTFFTHTPNRANSRSVGVLKWSGHVKIAFQCVNPDADVKLGLLGPAASVAVSHEIPSSLYWMPGSRRSPLESLSTENRTFSIMWLGMGGVSGFHSAVVVDLPESIGRRGELDIVCSWVEV